MQKAQQYILIHGRIHSTVSYERAEFVKESVAMETVESIIYNSLLTYTHVHILLDYHVAQIEFMYMTI
jgi:hypothetical protein